MKRFNKILLFLLIVPLSIAFSSCKKKENPDNSNQNQIEQPTTPAPDEDEPNYESPKETYSVFFDYNLPEEYDFLLANNDFELEYREVGTNTALAKVPDLKLRDYFLGWAEEGSDEVLNETITSITSRKIYLKGVWDEAALNKYYYSDGLTIDVVDGKASIVSYTGTDETIFIPEAFKSNDVDYDLTEIQTSAFEAKQFDKLIVHASNLYIGDSAFKDTNLSSFDFEKVNKIGKNAFENTKFVDLNLDDGISSIGEAAFQNCALLESVDFNNNNIKISKDMFKGCSKLEIVGNTKFVSRVGESAFEDCVSLINTDFIGSSVEIIEQFAFKNCTKLMSITLPESLTDVYSSAFEGCTSVTELVLGRLFENQNLAADSLVNHIGNIGENIRKITLVGDSITTLPEYYFDSLTNLQTFIMSDSVTDIENYAFRDCENLENISFSDKLDADKLSYLSLFGTKFINKLTAPWVYDHQVIYVPETIDAEFEFLADDAVVGIRNGAFANRKSLQKITIPSSIKSIGDGAFEGCVNLKEVIFDENSNITSLAKRIFSGCTKLSVIDLTKLKTLTTIDDYALSGVSVPNMVIPSSVTNLGFGVFYQAEISSYSISGTSSIFEVQDGVLYKNDVDDKLLLNYPTLKEDELFFCPSDVTCVAAYAFSKVVNLKYVYFENVMAWEEFNNGSGDVSTKSFEGSARLKLFAEKPAFNSDEVSYIYRWVSLNVTYDENNGTVILDDNFSTEEKYLYMTVLNQSTHKIDIVYFEIVTSNGEGGVKTYTVKDGSVKVIETNKTE